jgi:bla regulator protein blaR1
MRTVALFMTLICWTIRRALRLSALKKAALAVAGVTAVVTPIMIGVYTPAVRAESPQVITPSTGLGEAKFDVASIKPGSSAGPPDEVEVDVLRYRARRSGHGTFHVENLPLHLLIQFAYNAKDYQIEGEPAWANSERYEVTAKTENNASFEQMRPMLRSLLAERFNLALHRVTKELPVYELTAAKGGLKTQKASCVNPDPNGPPPPLPRPHGSELCGGVRSRIFPTGSSRLEGFGVPMSKLVEVLADGIGRTVVDKTGFSGTFNFQLDFSPEDAASIPKPAPTAAGGPERPIPGANVQAPTIFAALQEQLGLRLQAVKGQVEALVIDHVQRPSPN